MLACQQRTQYYCFFVKEPWIDDVLSQVLAVLLAYWDRHAEWTEVENRLQLFLSTFILHLILFVLHNENMLYFYSNNPVISITYNIY